MENIKRYSENILEVLRVRAGLDIKDTSKDEEFLKLPYEKVVGDLLTVKVSK